MQLDINSDEGLMNPPDEVHVFSPADRAWRLDYTKNLASAGMACRTQRHVLTVYPGVECHVYVVTCWYAGNHPRLDKAGPLTHALDCDLDEDCTCGPGLAGGRGSDGDGGIIYHNDGCPRCVHCSCEKD